MLSCFGSLSRNRQCGSRIAKGEKVEDVVKSIGTVEGIPTLQVLYKYLQDSDKEIMVAGLISSLYKIIYEDLDMN